MLGFDLSECEKGKTCLTWLKFDLSTEKLESTGNKKLKSDKNKREKEKV